LIAQIFADWKVKNRQDDLQILSKVGNEKFKTGVEQYTTPYKKCFSIPMRDLDLTVAFRSQSETTHPI
jgi:hypothetical protein